MVRNPLAAANVTAFSGADILPLDMIRTEKSIFQALVDARTRYGGKRQAIVDGDERVMTYDELVRAALALGNAFHITSDEVMTWDQFYTITAEAAGVEAKVVHITSDFMGACMPEEIGSLTGDKSASVVFDNSKIKRLVPAFGAKVPFAQGIRRTIDWFDADPMRKVIDEEANAAWDKMIDAYEGGLTQALQKFRS